MLKFMLSTSICTFTIKNKPVHVREWPDLDSGRMYINSVTLMEFIYGTEKDQMPERNLVVIEGFVSRLVVLDYDSAAVMHTGQIKVELVRQRRPIEPLDQMIAGYIRSRDLTVVTSSTQEFERAAGIRLEGWN